MLRRKSAAVTSSRKEKATCATSSVLAIVTRRRLRPAVRPASFSVSGDAGARRFDGGDHAEYQSGGQRHEKRRRRTLRRPFLVRGSSQRPVICQTGNRCPCQARTRPAHAAEDAEQHAFGEQLADQARAAGATWRGGWPFPVGALPSVRAAGWPHSSRR